MNRSARNALLLPLPIINLAYAGLLPLWLIGMVFILISVTCFDNIGNASLRTKSLLLLAAIGGVGAIIVQYKGISSRDAGLGLLLLMCTLKWMELRYHRDLIIIVVLYYFLLAGLLLFSHDIGAAALAWLGFWLTTRAWLGLYVNPKPPLRAAHFRVAKLLSMALPGTLILFLFFPRMTQPVWQSPSYSAQTGIGEQLQPGSLSSLSLSDEIALQVQFHGPVPAPTQRYFRGLVFWQTDGVVWTPRKPNPKRYNHTALSKSANVGIDYDIVLAAHHNAWLYSLDIPVDSPKQAHLSDDLQLLLAAPLRGRIRYTMRSVLHASISARPGDISAGLQLSDLNNPYSRALAKRWRQQSKSVSRYIERVRSLFRDGGFAYTLQPPLLGKKDPIDVFLLQSRRGFCGHFASAFAFLMRAAGIPARIVVGYQGGEIDPQDGRLIVRQRDAHAWVEVLLPQQGWTRFDPTAVVAPERIARGSVATTVGWTRGIFGLLAQRLGPLRDSVDQADAAYRRWISHFDRTRQIAWMKRWSDLPWSNWQALLLSTLVLCLAGVTIYTTLCATKARRTPTVVRLYDAVCRGFAKKGWPRQAWEGPLAYADRLSLAFPKSAAVLHEFANSYANLRFGPHKNAHQLRQFKKVIKRLSLQLHRNNECHLGILQLSLSQIRTVLVQLAVANKRIKKS